MTQFLPLRGLKYNLQKFDSLDELICPPFDLISSNLKNILENKNPYNAVWLEGTSQIKDGSENKYLDSKNTFNKWLNNEIIIRDEIPLYYLVKYRYMLNGTAYSVAKIIGMLQVEDLSTGNIVGHENTYPPIVEDRIKLLETTGVQFSPILAAFKDASGTVKTIVNKTLREEAEAHINITTTDSLDIWSISNNDDIQSIKTSLNDSTVFIADGHHRYDAALGIQNSNTSTFESQHIMTALIDLDDPGLQILPYHRIMENINEELTALVHCKLSEICINHTQKNVEDIGSQSLLDLISKTTQNIHTICTLSPQKNILNIYNMDPQSSEDALGELAHSDAWILQSKVIDSCMQKYPSSSLTYTHDLTEGIISKDSLAIFLGPFPKPAFEKVALSETNMPPKSTFFYPKMPTGLLFHPIYMGP